MITAMAASSFPSLEAEEVPGEFRLALAAPWNITRSYTNVRCSFHLTWRICSERDTAAPTPVLPPSPPLEVVAGVTGVLLRKDFKY